MVEVLFLSILFLVGYRVSLLFSFSERRRWAYQNEMLQHFKTLDFRTHLGPIGTIRAMEGTCFSIVCLAMENLPPTLTHLYDAAIIMVFITSLFLSTGLGVMVQFLNLIYSFLLVLSFHWWFCVALCLSVVNTSTIVLTGLSGSG